jgi:hypothetical protein
MYRNMVASFKECYQEAAPSGSSKNMPGLFSSLPSIGYFSVPRRANSQQWEMIGNFHL